MFVNVPTGALATATKVSAATIVDSVISSTVDIEYTEWNKPDPSGGWKLTLLTASQSYASTGVVPTFPTVNLTLDLKDEIFSDTNSYNTNIGMEFNDGKKEIEKN